MLAKPGTLLLLLLVLLLLPVKVVDDDDDCGPVVVWFSLLAKRLSLSVAMLPTGWPLLVAPVADEAGVAVEVDTLETLPVKLAPAGSVSLLKNISRLLCNCPKTKEK